MGHIQPAPESQRPTIDELRHHQSAFTNQPKEVIYRITGKWTLNLEAEFKVTVTGDIADVQELWEMLRENGNLIDLEVECLNG